MIERRHLPLIALLLALVAAAPASVPLPVENLPPPLQRLLHPSPAKIDSTGITRADYLKLIAADIDFFRTHQNADGAIIDPVAGREIQYSTPAFALAAGLCATEGKRDDLREPAERALSCACRELSTHTAADHHEDFFAPLVMHAIRLLKSRASPAVRERWEQDLRKIVPEKIYHDHTASMNWNLVNVCGELLRRKDGLVLPDQRAAQMSYIEKSLAIQAKRLTPLGLYVDPNAPLAYDAFPRLWLEDLLADKAYDGAEAGMLRKSLLRGGLSTLLMLSPSGEWPCGGRSAQHQWNEAQATAICEINAVRWKAAGRDDIAGQFKRCAHLACASVSRWQRPGGELWIVKNRAEPDKRFGYEGYSSCSQYNLLPMAMLTLAWIRSDEVILEQAAPSETGGYVLDLRESFHKVIAAAAGYYIEIDTSADPHYNATGLQRVHRTGVTQPLFSDSAAADRAYGPAGAHAALAPALEWKDASGEFIGADDFVNPSAEKQPKSDPPAGTVAGAELAVSSEKPDRVAFTLTYRLEGPAARGVVEEYVITGDGVDCTAHLSGNAPSALRLQLPALTSDGAAETAVHLNGSSFDISHLSSTVRWTVIEPPNVSLAPTGGQLPTHNGLVQAMTADLPPGVSRVRYRITLKQRAAPPH